jgi:hypothetical protein
MIRTKTFMVSLAAVLVWSADAAAWYGKGHDLATRVSLAALQGRAPAFFTAGVETIAHCSLDGDAFTRPIAPGELHEQEAPEQYFDLELMGGAPVPPSRYAFIEFCAQRGLKPNKVGLLPYAVAEWSQRLTVALAEHRRWPTDPHIRVKCLVYAGILAHYAQDLCQPLHLTIHWDGRAKEDGSSPRSGIHNRLDALMGKLRVNPHEVAAGLSIEPVGELMPAVLAEINRGRALIDRAYELERQFPAMEEPLAAEGNVADFAAERLRAAGKFLASLYLTAWVNSEKIALPPWHRQGTPTGEAVQEPGTAPSQAAEEPNAPGRKVLHRTQSLKTNVP